MQVYVDGFDDREEIQLLREFTFFCAETLCDDDSIIDELRIRIVKDLSLLKEQKWADCTATDTHSDVRRHFTIRHLGQGRGMSLMSVFRLHAHEMTHVRQFMLGELQFLGNDIVRWGNDYLDTRELMDWCEPWELEARGYEKGLVELWCRERGYHSAGWYQSLP